jgi:hypothetical protein
MSAAVRQTRPVAMSIADRQIRPDVYMSISIMVRQSRPDTLAISLLLDLTGMAVLDSLALRLEIPAWKRYLILTRQTRLRQMGWPAVRRNSIFVKTGIAAVIEVFPARLSRAVGA